MTENVKTLVPFHLANKPVNKKTKEKTTTCTELPISQYKSRLSYKSYDDLISELKVNLKKSKLNESSLDIDILSQKKIKVNTIDLVSALSECCDLAKLTNDKGLQGQLFIENPSSYLMTSEFEFIEMMLSDISKKPVSRDNKESLNLSSITIEIDDITKTALKIVSHLRNRSDIRKLQPIPTSYLVTKSGQIINLLTKEISDVQEMRFQYDIINTSNIDIVNYNEQSNEERAISSLYRQIITRVMKDWSNNDKDVEYLLWQIAFAILQNDNHDKFFILKGPGGNGKSTFMELLGQLAGESNIVRANIHQFGDPNSINTLSMQTRLIIGDDAATNHKISDTALSNLKTLTTGQAISLPVKYEKNRIVKTRGLFIQGTNTDISFFENNKAIKSRTIVIDWCPTDFRSNKSSDITFNLDELIYDQSFINEFFMMCLEKVEYFEKFSIPDTVKRSTNEMIESNDTIKQFLDDVIYSINHFEKIPIKIIFNKYVEWSKETNPKGGLMKIHTFVKALHEKESAYGFSVSENSTRFRKFINTNSLSTILNLDISNLSDNQRYLEFNNSISQSELDRFLNSNHPKHELTEKEIQMLYILIHDYHHTFLQSLYSFI